MRHSPDRLAISCAAAEARARKIRDDAATALSAAQDALARLAKTPLPKFDATAAAAKVARAQASDQVHNTETAAELAQHFDGQRTESAAAAEKRAGEVAALEQIIAERKSALGGCEAVLNEAIESARAVVARAARERLVGVQQAYRDALLAAVDLATDLWALQALAAEPERPRSQALRTKAVPLVFPALACFGDEHRAALQAVGAVLNGTEAVVLNTFDAHQQAMADFDRIRGELTTVSTTTEED